MKVLNIIFKLTQDQKTQDKKLIELINKEEKN